VSSQHFAARFGFACLVAVVAAGEAYAQQALTLQEVFARALNEAPDIKAAEQARIGAEAGIRQADRMPNPTIDFMAENIAGSGSHQSFDRAETTLALSQKLEWGGDRDARTQLARAEVTAVRSAGDVRRQDLLRNVELAYLAAQKAGAELQVAMQRADLAREIVATVERRVQAARDPLLAGARSKALLAEAEIAVEGARLSEQAAKAQLALLWAGDTNFIVDPTSFQSFGNASGGGVGGSAELALATAQEAAASATIALENARGRQDPIISGGVRYFHDTDDAALVVGFAIPLPLWGKNEGAIARSEAERSRLRYESEALRRNMEREAAAARAQMGIAQKEIESIDARLLPAAEEALASARQGYNAGGFSYLDVLEAQRIVVDARLQRISAFHSYHSARVALARLTGAYAGDGAAQ
jgi:cobalt-zinc-cadmium efflux system outer membrane protein